jgi:hypothetical protein
MYAACNCIFLLAKNFDEKIEQSLQESFLFVAAVKYNLKKRDELSAF